MEHEQYNEILIHPVFNLKFISSEHYDGQYNSLGDMLGRDCVVVKFVDGWLRMYADEGKENEDWYGWNADVLAPCDSIVDSIYENNIINTPGSFHAGRAGLITFKKNDGSKICYAHVTDINVKVGDEVKAGDIVAKVGNNGTSRMPHIHIGAWFENEPLQIRFDLKAMGRLMSENKSNSLLFN
jgi:hypothetical protein